MKSETLEEQAKQLGLFSQQKSELNLQELVQLISIREHTYNILNNEHSPIDKTTALKLQGLLPLLDKKIIGLLQSDDLKASLKK